MDAVLNTKLRGQSAQLRFKRAAANQQQLRRGYGSAVQGEGFQQKPMVLDLNHTPHIANDRRILRYAKLVAAGAPRLGVKAERVRVNGIRQNMYRGRDAHQRRFRGV